ncbi:hypothetical protein ACRRTK_008555 [Alexandromys fortis]
MYVPLTQYLGEPNTSRVSCLRTGVAIPGNLRSQALITVTLGCCDLSHLRSCFSSCV